MKNKLTGKVHASSGPVTSPPGYYLCIFLDKQEPWPVWIQNGQRVEIMTTENESKNPI